MNMLKLIGIRGGQFCLLISAIVSLSASFCAFAGSAAADGTDFVVSADSGETYTYSTDVGNYTRLVKRGAGEVVLDTASKGFSGSVVVEEGTLTITEKDALGKSESTSTKACTLPITVESGATLHLKLPGATKFGHNITIAGKGVNDVGAFKYTRSNSSGYSDALINSLTLSADATIDVSARWGMGNNKIIELNGHTLTRIGSDNWVVYNRIMSTGAQGEVNNVYGTLTFQGSPDIDENVTVVVTNVSSTSVLGLWGASSVGTVKGKIKLYSGRTIQAQSGTGRTSNNIGPLHLAGPKDKSATLTIEKDNAVRAMSVDGPVTGDSGMGLTINGKGSIWFNNDVSVSGNTVIQGGGNTYLCGDGAKRDMRFVLKGSTTVTHETGNTYARMLRVANGGAVAAQFRQTGGMFAVGSGDNARLAGESDGSRGYFTLEGGETHFSNSVYMAEYKGSFGAFRQTGGLCELRRPANGINERWFCAGRGGSAVFVQTGGTNDTLYVSTSQQGGFLMSTNGTAEVTVSGTGTLFQTTLFQLGTTGSVCTNILNVRDGAVFKANRLNKTNLAAAGTKGYVNVDGGILMPTFFSNWSGHNNATDYNPDHFVVYGNGMIVDTSENSANSSAGLTTMSYVLEKPTGKGVESIELPDISNWTFIGLGRIVIEDETGWGATAYAEFDFATKTLTSVVVTSRGCDYSDNAKAYLESPDGTSRRECALTLSSNDGRCGMFVKRGSPTLELSSAASTIDGGYAVEGGSLKLGVVPKNVAVPVRVESGATLNLNSKGALIASTFEGAGTVTNGNVTVTNAVRATCADLFSGKSAYFAGDLTFDDGAVFEITDAENLDDYKDAGRVDALTVTGTISGEPSVKFTNSDGTTATVPDSWNLSSDGKSLKFGCDKGLLIIIK